MRNQGVRCAAWLVVALAMMATACTGRGESKDGSLASQTGVEHLDLVGSEAMMVVSMRHIPERARTIRDSKALAFVVETVERVLNDPEIQREVQRQDEILALLERHLKGQITMVVYDLAEDEGSKKAFMIIVDTDARALFEAAKGLLDPEGEPANFESVGEGILRLVEEPDGEPGLFILQAGGVGILGSSAEVVREAAARGAGGGGRLTEELSFKSLTKDLDRSQDMFVWLKDWTEGDEWGSMVTGGHSVPRGVAGTVDLSSGVEVNMEMEMGPEDFPDPEARAVLPIFSEVSRPPTIPKVLGAESLGYVGVQISVKELVKLLEAREPELMQGLGQGDEQAQHMLKLLTNSFDGEFGFAVTGPAPDGALPSPELGFVPPGFVIVGRLTTPDVALTLEPMMGMALGFLQDGPDQVLGPATVERIGELDVKIHTTSDPGVELGFVFVKEYLVIGNRAGLRGALPRIAAGGGEVALGGGRALVRESFEVSSNGQLHLNLPAIYEIVKGQLGMQMVILSGGVLGGPDDPLAVMLQVFKFAGGTVSIRGDRVKARLYLTAEDLVR